MKKLFVAAAFAALALPAFAGGGSCLKTGFRCENSCPLAQKANVCRALGTEALATSKVVRVDVSKVVLDNLARI